MKKMILLGLLLVGLGLVWRSPFVAAAGQEQKAPAVNSSVGSESESSDARYVQMANEVIALNTRISTLESQAREDQNQMSQMRNEINTLKQDTVRLRNDENFDRGAIKTLHE